MLVPIEVSAKHIHLKKEDLESLFGKSYELKKLRGLSQLGTFAAHETVTLKSEKNEIKNVRILGPIRDYTQIEISRSDAYFLGIDPPVRDTHEIDHAGTPGITLKGSYGEIKLKKGVIIAWRHIHANHNEALELGVKDGQLVKVDIDSDPRSVIFENVLIRIGPGYELAMHIDTDEANAAGIEKEGVGKLLV